MRALIVDPALRSLGGHHYNATLALNAKLAALGIDRDCLGSAYADEQTVHDLGCVPCFTKSVYGRGYENPGEFEQHVRATFDELSMALEQRPAPDLVILPCCDQVLASTFARYLHPGQAPHLLIWALYAPHHNGSFDGPEMLRLRQETRRAYTALRSIVGSDRISVFCETPQMAAAYRGLTGFEIGIAPGPGLIGARHVRRSSGPPVVCCIGFANEAKGYRLLPDAVHRVMARDAGVQFMVHGVFQGSDARDQRQIFDALAGLGPRVTVSTDVLSQAAYVEWLGRADLVLLPYDPTVYRTRGSGVFFEASRLGIPVIATEGCGFAQPAFDEGWGIRIARHDAPSVAEAVLRGLQRLDDMTVRARSAARAGNEVDRILETEVRAAVNGRGKPARSGR